VTTQQDIPLAVEVSSTEDQHGVAVRFVNDSRGMIDVGMPHPENPYVTELRDSSGCLLETGWGVFAPPKPLWVATLNPLTAVDAVLPLSRIYWLHAPDVPLDTRKTPAVNGKYSISFDIPWLDTGGHEQSLSVSGCIVLQLGDSRHRVVGETVSRFRPWSAEEIRRQRSGVIDVSGRETYE